MKSADSYFCSLPQAGLAQAQVEPQGRASGPRYGGVRGDTLRRDIREIHSASHGKWRNSGIATDPVPTILTRRALKLVYVHGQLPGAEPVAESRGIISCRSCTPNLEIIKPSAE